MLCQPQDLVWQVVLAPDVCNRPTMYAVRLLLYLLCFLLHATICWLTTCEIADKTKPRQKINLQLNCWNIIQHHLIAQVCISRNLASAMEYASSLVGIFNHLCKAKVRVNENIPRRSVLSGQDDAKPASGLLHLESFILPPFLQSSISV